jgi:hypothetical protein
VDCSGKPIRPYFLPVDVDHDSLPEPVRIALDEIVEPAYRELVLGAATALGRSAGVSLVFLLAEEILGQFQLGGQMDFGQAPDPSRRAERDKLIAAHLRVVNSKQQTANFILRLKDLRYKPTFSSTLQP